VVSVKLWKKADVISSQLHPLIANLLVSPRSPRKTTCADVLGATIEEQLGVNIVRSHGLWC
jgi:hypothetical protein